MRALVRLLPLLALLVLPASPALATANADGSLDTSFGGIEYGQPQVAFNLGGDKSDGLLAMRVLQDGRLVLVGRARNAASTYDLAVAVRTPAGLADTSLTPGGQYHLPLPIAFGTGAAAAIAADGSYYAVGTAGDQLLRVWHYALDGSLLDGPHTIGVSGEVYTSTTAMVDAQGRLLVAGYKKVGIGAADTTIDGFVLRLDTGGALDAGFGIRTIAFDAGARDDILAIAEGRTGGIAVCGQVGNLPSSDLHFGVALLRSSGAFDTGFNGSGLYVDQLALNGSAASSPCNDVAVMESSQGRRIAIAGRADRSGQSSRAFVVVMDVSAQIVPGGVSFLDFNRPDDYVATFPVLLAGPSPWDRDALYVAAAGAFSLPPYTLSVARIDATGNLDTAWGDSAGTTEIGISLPAIDGTARSLVPTQLAYGGGRLYVGATVFLDAGDTDLIPMRLTGDHIFQAPME